MLSRLSPSRELIEDRTTTRVVSGARFGPGPRLWEDQTRRIPPLPALAIFGPFVYPSRAPIIFWEVMTRLERKGPIPAQEEEMKRKMVRREKPPPPHFICIMSIN